MKKIITLCIFFCCSFSIAQTIISGIITDAKNEPIFGANVYLKGTYDGASTNEKGEFNFTTEEKGVQVLVISFVSFETKEVSLDVSKMQNITIQLRENVDALDAVVLSAGSFEAGENAKVTALKPLDIVTTASALGDFVGALQTLPGTSTVAEDGRLFVRGGRAEETQIFIDGIRVFTPYSNTTNNIPARGRYSPFLFKGITFSTGGYSAEYGQALSGVLELNTINEPDQEKTDISIMTVGGGVGHTEKWKKGSVSFSTSYINLAPYLALFPDRNDWIKPFQGGQGESVFRHHFKNGTLKFYTAFDITDFELDQESINFDELVRFKLNNNNLYMNASYKGTLSDDWGIATGISYTRDRTKLRIINDRINSLENSIHVKAKLKKKFSNRFKLNFGAEYFTTDFDEEFKNETISSVNYGFNNNLFGAFAESDIFFSKNFAAKVGVRFDHASLLDKTTISPRLSVAYKTSEKDQVSFAFGQFYQNPNNTYLKFNSNFIPENATHYIVNYQYVHEGKTFRAEAYHKKYNDLVTFSGDIPQFGSDFGNDGFGHATGLDIFWRDNKSIKNVDYWVSYSYLDTSRKFENFPTEAMPNFATKHNFSVVTKYWVDSLKSQVGFSYNYASGRPYTNPNVGGFLNERTKDFHSVSVNWAYLISQQKILYFSLSNAAGVRNVFGYEYANQPDMNGIFQRRTLRPAQDQFFFIGFFWTISDDGKSNQLDTL
ncbi:outer membrane cobalamin receptor [Kordia periserrulae]|uniref:Outer membrane cobalamin receptor n=1 Tax=Kordia periserrulae TaxID=701523 RepID=A0A2T6C152_9FLAO|nr:TonB-dependent receptor [Kordia periserrulae]PTX62053.1 outer membrane cobalamin receptor [Kordia periserrulae]